MVRTIVAIVFLLTASAAYAASGYCPPISFGTLVNVKSNGAAGDGVTDDTAAIQGVINSTAGTGNTVYIPAGTYMINAICCQGGLLGLFVNLSNVNILMDTGAVLKAIPNSSDGYNVIWVHNGVSNVNIVGGTILGDRYTHLGTAGEFGMGIAVYGATNVNIFNVTSRQMWGDGFYLGTGSPATVTFCNVTADENRRQGLSIVTANGVVVTNSTFKNTGKKAGSAGGGTAPASGIDIEPASAGDTANNININNSQFINNDKSGVVATLAPGLGAFITNVMVRGNVFRINDQHFYNVNPEGEIVLLNVSGVNVLSNNIYTDVQDGIHLATNATGNTISGNLISGVSGYGIEMESGSTGNVVKKNNISSKKKAIQDAGGNTVSSNFHQIVPHRTAPRH